MKKTICFFSNPERMPARGERDVVKREMISSPSGAVAGSRVISSPILRFAGYILRLDLRT